MKLNLYTVSEIYLSACESLLEMDELPDDVVADTIESLSGEFEEKAINVAGYCKNLQKEIEAMKNYERDMKERRNVLEKQVTRLTEYLKTNMEKCHFSKIKGAEFTISIRLCPASVVIDDIDELPSQFSMLKMLPDKMLIKRALQNGTHLEWAHLENKTSLVIK